VNDNDNDDSSNNEDNGDNNNNMDNYDNEDNDNNKDNDDNNNNDNNDNNNNSILFGGGLMMLDGSPILADMMRPLSHSYKMDASLVQWGNLAFVGTLAERRLATKFCRTVGARGAELGPTSEESSGALAEASRSTLDCRMAPVWDLFINSGEMECILGIRGKVQVIPPPGERDPNLITKNWWYCKHHVNHSSKV
jgi:hypothetical protein